MIEVPKIAVDPLTKKALSVKPEAGDINRIEIIGNMVIVEYVDSNLILRAVEIPVEEVEKAEEPVKYVENKIKELTEKEKKRKELIENLKATKLLS